MTPQQYRVAIDSFWAAIDSLEKEAEKKRNEKNEFTRWYCDDVFSKSEYKLGQKITDKEGKVWFVSGAHVCGDHVMLSLNPAKKDGTMSKVTFIARGEPRIFLN